VNLDFCKRTPLYIEEFTYFAAKQLGLHLLRGDIHVAYRTTLDNDSYGLCWGDNREADIQIASKMSNQKITRKDKLLTVAHELVHARQFLKRELHLGSMDGECTWRGRFTTYDVAKESDAPWEVEAVAVEQPVYEAWRLHKMATRTGWMYK